MSDSNSKIVAAFGNATKATSIAQANRVLMRFNGRGGLPESVPAHLQKEAAAALYDLAFAESEGRTNATPQSLDDVHDAAYAKWNRPKPSENA